VSHFSSVFSNVIKQFSTPRDMLSPALSSSYDLNIRMGQRWMEKKMLPRVVPSKTKRLYSLCSILFNLKKSNSILASQIKMEPVVHKNAQF
jgi:hypothetical protein